MSDVTVILDRAQQGDAGAAGELLPLVYNELRRLAAHKMASEAGGHTLQPTALVHEAWLRLVSDDHRIWDGRAHFFAAAAEAMRRFLIDHARRKRAVRRGGGQLPTPLDDMEIVAPVKDEDLLLVSEALDKFAVRDHQKAELVKLRYFVGLTLEEAAEVMGVAVPTASRWWAYSRAWLAQEIERQRNVSGE
jgi:RNA polymerase sigma factor (TIGR02999 family)